MTLTRNRPAAETASGKTRRLGFLALPAVAALTLGGALPATAAPEQPGPDAVIAASVTVFVNCNADGSYAWTATGEGFSPNTQYFVTSQAGYTSNNGSGSWTGTSGHGAQRASSGGFVTTPTYYSGADLDRASVRVYVTIGGVDGVGGDDC